MCSSVNPNYSFSVNLASTVTGLAGAAFLGPIEAIRIIGMTILAGVSYGIVNDLFACRDCIEYFTAGHIYAGKRLEARPVLSLNPNLNALVWGQIATWHVSAIAGGVFSFLARFSFGTASVSIGVAQLGPYLLIGALAGLIFSHIGSRFARAYMEKKPFLHYRDVPIHLQAGWHACNVRNTLGYLTLTVGSSALSIAILAARVGLVRL